MRTSGNYPAVEVGNTVTEYVVKMARELQEWRAYGLRNMQ
jgi:hypothetical protein